MRKGIMIENVIDSSSLEVNILANVSAVVPPVGLFLKHFLRTCVLAKGLKELVHVNFLPDAVPYVLVGNVMKGK